MPSLTATVVDLLPIILLRMLDVSASIFRTERVGRERERKREREKEREREREREIN